MYKNLEGRFHNLRYRKEWGKLSFGNLKGPLEITRKHIANGIKKRFAVFLLTARRALPFPLNQDFRHFFDTLTKEPNIKVGVAQTL